VVSAVRLLSDRKNRASEIVGLAMTPPLWATIFYSNLRLCRHRTRGVQQIIARA
jgi:hypothetical protein